MIIRKDFGNEEEIKRAIRELVIENSSYNIPQMIYIVDEPELIIPYVLPQEIDHFCYVESKEDILQNPSGPILILDNGKSPWVKAVLKEIKRIKKDGI